MVLSWDFADFSRWPESCRHTISHHMDAASLPRLKCAPRQDVSNTNHTVQSHGLPATQLHRHGFLPLHVLVTDPSGLSREGVLVMLSPSIMPGIKNWIWKQKHIVFQNVRLFKFQRLTYEISTSDFWNSARPTFHENSDFHVYTSDFFLSRMSDFSFQRPTFALNVRLLDQQIMNWGGWIVIPPPQSILIPGLPSIILYLIFGFQLDLLPSIVVQRL